jgi:capsular exopolysaccharide synthesis family protein
MTNPNSKKYLHLESKSLRDYLLLIRNNLKTFLFLSLIIVILTIGYAILAKNIYKSTVTVRITQQNQNILKNTQDILDTELLDRFIATEIGVIGNYNTREIVARALIDSFENTKNQNLFDLVKSKKNEGINGHKTVEHLASILSAAITAEQIPGTDAVEISAESTSPYEAALIVNTCAIEYQKINLASNREKLTSIRKFLEKQNQEKLAELQTAEDTLMKVQEKSGLISMDVQSQGLLDQLSSLDAQKQETKIELMTSNEVLKQYKFFLNKQDPQLVDYLENATSQAYITALQQQIADLQVNRDLAVSIKNPNLDISSKVKEYDQRIGELKEKLNSAINSIKAEGFSGNPEQVSHLAQQLIEEQIKNSTLSVKFNQLETLTKQYEQKLRGLPKASTELSQFQRKREVLQQSFLEINQKYQEAMINELSQSGNVFLISEGRIPDSPEKPNRKLMIIFGFILGPSLAFFFLLIKDYFNDKIESPDDIEKNDINLLAWIPQLTTNGKISQEKIDLTVFYELDSPINEAFKSIKTRILFSTADSDSSKQILVTSPAEHEGKTFVAINLAGTFAQSNKRTLLIDCDLRRPRIHTVMGVNKIPGVADYLTNKATLEEIIKVIKPNNLSYITAGSIPSHPVEMIESEAMQNFLHEMRDFFDVVIVDSAPIVSVIDAEILSKMVDGTILVLSADKTETKLMMNAVELIKNNRVPFFGTVLNNFKKKSGYDYYYKYHYNYKKSSDRIRKGKFRIKT